MIKLTLHHHFFQYHLIDLNLHIAQEGHNYKDHTRTIHTIYQHLIIINASTYFQLKPTNKYKPNILQFTSDVGSIDRQGQLGGAQCG